MRSVKCVGRRRLHHIADLVDDLANALTDLCCDLDDDRWLSDRQSNSLHEMRCRLDHTFDDAFRASKNQIDRMVNEVNEERECGANQGAAE